MDRLHDLSIAEVLVVSYGVLAVSVLLLAGAMRLRRRSAVTGVEGLVGEIGESVASFDGGGKVFVHGEYWDAVVDGHVRPGERVRVTGVEGRLLRVERAEEPLATA